MSTAKKQDRPETEAGFSLIEIIITSLILGIGVWMASGYFGKAQKQAAQQVAQDHALKTKQRLADLLKRDLGFVVNPTDVTLTTAHDMTIRRPKIMPGNNRPDLTQTYQVRYRAVCASLPSNLQTQLGAFNFTTLASTLQKRSSCTGSSTLACGPGTYPQLRIEADTGANIPIYQGTHIPNLTPQTKIHQETLGVLPCFQRNGNQVTIGLDVYHANSTGDLALDLKGERYYMVIGNVSDMIILQK